MKTKAKTNVPGIDSADHLFSICTRDGGRSAYIRIQEQTDGSYAYAITVDDDRAHYCEDIGSPAGGFTTMKDALREALPQAVESFAGEAFVYADDLRPHVRAFRRESSRTV